MGSFATVRADQQIYWVSGDGSCLGQPRPNSLVKARSPYSTGQATQVRRCNAVAQGVRNIVRLPKGGGVHAGSRLADGMACVARSKTLATGGHDEAASQSTYELLLRLTGCLGAHLATVRPPIWSVAGCSSPQPFAVTTRCQVIALPNRRRKDHHQFRIALSFSQSKRSRATGGSCLRIASCSE